MGRGGSSMSVGGTRRICRNLAGRGVFLPWYIFKEYRKGFENEEEKEKFRKSVGQDPLYGGEEEEKLLGLSTEYDVGEEEPLRFEVTLEHLNWRRDAISIQANGDLQLFKQEFPATRERRLLRRGGVFLTRMR